MTGKKSARQPRGRKLTLAMLVSDPDRFFSWIQGLFPELPITAELAEYIWQVKEKIKDDPDVAAVDLNKLDVGFEAFPKIILGAYVKNLDRDPEALTIDDAHFVARITTESLLRFAQFTVFKIWQGNRTEVPSHEIWAFVEKHPSMRGLEASLLNLFPANKARGLGSAAAFSIN